MSWLLVTDSQIYYPNLAFWENSQLDHDVVIYCWIYAASLWKGFLNLYSWVKLTWDFLFLCICQVLVSKFCWLLKSSWEYSCFLYSLEEFVENMCYFFLKYLVNSTVKPSGSEVFLMGKFFNYIFIWVDIELLRLLFFLYHFG